ncbi:glyoxylate/hydroxypyruvate reductase A [Herbaspirillum sp. meg3]|jgi:glyoxylate/hydroxypyruvate reductase A|uniref:2-hydroxyacid dehydrogenase n=1 Tax=Herbaspirillum sp. meg3 TaxID=2025949 RepID=UPI000B9942E5|nr:glyoxylate/hydroxypyruvate reductase A [Herbaspirillum sp. meg3]ASU40958.1 glyoxylate/hydroxypyruvate reductase A [Herbaspirillum sp. meg3]
MTKVVFLGVSSDVPKIAVLARERTGDIEVLLPGDAGAEEAEVAVCWSPPPGALATYPRLRLIHAIAAGVDNILCDPYLPALPLCRVVAPDLTVAMTEFITWGVLYYHRDLDRALANQRNKIWHRTAPAAASSRTVGIMGVGQLGAHVAGELLRTGFKVRGWSRQEKTVEGMESFYGENQFDDFLGGTDILVCLLPLTAQTQGILNRATLSALPEGAALIHVGRGGHLVSAEVQAMLENGHLRGAILDVFEKEPLSVDSPFWSMPNVIVTPHIAAAASYDSVLDQIEENIRRLQHGEPLRNLVDRSSGY